MEIMEDQNHQSLVCKRPNNSENKNCDIFTGCILNDEAEIHKLSDDCLTHIFTFLPLIDRLNVERVCTRWKIVSLQSWYTFKKFDCSKETWGDDDDNFSTQRLVMISNFEKILYRCGFFLTHIDLSRFPERDPSKEAILGLKKYCPNLQNIKLCPVFLSHENELSQLFLNSKKLRDIELTVATITGECLLNLPTDCMKTLVINVSSKISPHCFVKVLSRLQKLQTLSFNSCKTINDDFIKEISLYTSLKNLKLTHYHQTNVCCYLFHVPQKVDLSPISQLINLESLDFENNHSVDDKTLKIIGANCKLLKYINISNCYEVSNEGLASIVSLPKLESLHICHLDKITDEVFTDMPNLRKLMCGSNKNLKNQGLCHLIQKSHNIELLDFDECSNLNNELVEAAIKAIRKRTTNVILQMHIYGTSINIKQIISVPRLLQIFSKRRDFHISRQKLTNQLKLYNNQ